MWGRYPIDIHVLYQWDYANNDINIFKYAFPLIYCTTVSVWCYKTFLNQRLVSLFDDEKIYAHKMHLLTYI
jgi:hypothetical protein